MSFDFSDLIKQLNQAKDGTLHQVWYRDGEIYVCLAISVGDDARWLAEKLNVEDA